MVGLVKVIVLTGTLGSGKSTVATIFERLGAKVIDSDVLAREVVLPESAGLDEIQNRFGIEYIMSSGALDRKKLGQLIFENPEKRKLLESILHPMIIAQYKEQINKLAASSKSPVLALSVIPLFFEARTRTPEIDKVIVVSAPKENCIQRVMKRDNCSLELATKKYDSQLPIEQKEKLADYVIKNEGPTEELEAKVQEIYCQIMT